MKIVLRTDDERYLKKIDTWTGSPKVILELTDNLDEALCYPSVGAADKDCEILNRETVRFGRIRRAVLSKYGEIRFERWVYES